MHRKRSTRLEALHRESVADATTEAALYDVWNDLIEPYVEARRGVTKDAEMDVRDKLVRPAETGAQGTHSSVRTTSA